MCFSDIPDDVQDKVRELLERRFPWLLDPDDEPSEVSGADVVDALIQLWEDLK